VVGIRGEGLPVWAFEGCEVDTVRPGSLQNDSTHLLQFFDKRRRADKAQSLPILPSIEQTVQCQSQPHSVYHSSSEDYTLNRPCTLIWSRTFLANNVVTFSLPFPSLMIKIP
jgi:hypothetical protein